MLANHSSFLFFFFALYSHRTTPHQHLAFHSMLTVSILEIEKLKRKDKFLTCIRGTSDSKCVWDTFSFSMSMSRSVIFNTYFSFLLLFLNDIFHTPWPSSPPPHNILFVCVCSCATYCLLSVFHSLYSAKFYFYYKFSEQMVHSPSILAKNGNKRKKKNERKESGKRKKKERKSEDEIVIRSQ